MTAPTVGHRIEGGLKQRTSPSIDPRYVYLVGNKPMKHGDVLLMPGDRVPVDLLEGLHRPETLLQLRRIVPAPLGWEDDEDDVDPPAGNDTGVKTKPKRTRKKPPAPVDHVAEGLKYTKAKAAAMAIAMQAGEDPHAIGNEFDLAMIQLFAAANPTATAVVVPGIAEAFALIPEDDGSDTGGEAPDGGTPEPEPVTLDVPPDPQLGVPEDSVGENAPDDEGEDPPED